MLHSSLLRYVPGGKTLALTIACILAAAGASPAQAQGRATGHYLEEAVVRVTNLAKDANRNNYGYNDGISILGGWVTEKASLEFTTPLTAGVEYKFIAGGDTDALDVDFELFDPNGNVVASDVGSAAIATVAYQPKTTGTYKLRMTLFKSNLSVPCVCVATILKKNGMNVPVANLDVATAKIKQSLMLGDQKAKENNMRVDLRFAPNQWAFFGGVLNQGASMSVTNLDLGTGDRVFVGAGDAFAKVINLDLEDVNNNNKAIKQDFGQNPVSVLDQNMQGGRHGLRVHNIQSNGPAVVVMAIMEVRP